MNMEILLCIYQKVGLLMEKQDKFTLKKSSKVVLNPQKPLTPSKEKPTLKRSGKPLSKNNGKNTKLSETIKAFGSGCLGSKN